MVGTHSIECNSAAKDIWQFYMDGEICILAISQGRKHSVEVELLTPDMSTY